MAPRTVPIDAEELGKLAALQCTEAEAAVWFGCSQATISRRLKNPALRAVWERGRAEGRVSLRRAQYHAAVRKHNAALLIWLGKQWLGQTESTAGVEDDGAVEGWLAHVKGRRRKRKASA